MNKSSFKFLFNGSRYIIKNNKKHKIFILMFMILTIIICKIKIINHKIKICLCVIAKNENLYIREFVEHYKKIGYNNLFIYNNNGENDENLAEPIKDYIKNGFVKIIDFARTNDDSRPQFVAYKDCYSRNGRKFDWLSFFDVDEFLEINHKYKTIQDFLSDKIFEHCDNIKINWLCYYNYKNLYYENKTLIERITSVKYDNPENDHIKSTVKGKLYKNYWEKMANPHSSLFKLKACSSSGKRIKFDSPFNIPPDYTKARLRHYNYKSFEEYCLKLKRGRSDFQKNESSQMINDRYKLLVAENRNNKEKLKIIYKIFNHSNYSLGHANDTI